MTVQDAIASLSMSERDAVLRRFTFRDVVEQELGEAKLYDLGIWKSGYIKHGESILTPFGTEVASALRKSHKPT